MSSVADVRLEGELLTEHLSGSYHHQIQLTFHSGLPCILWDTECTHNHPFQPRLPLASQAGSWDWSCSSHPVEGTRTSCSPAVSQKGDFRKILQHISHTFLLQCCARISIGQCLGRKFLSGDYNRISRRNPKNITVNMLARYVLTNS